MNQLFTSTTAAVIESARAMLRSEIDWPSPAAGLAYQVFMQSSMPAPDFMATPLRATTGALLRRTPELAGFGYVIDRCDPATVELWLEGAEHLRGRDIYPSDRQSFIFNPIEILGVTVGLRTCGTKADDHRKWLFSTITSGLDAGQFRTALSVCAAKVALALLTEGKLQVEASAALDVETIGTPELIFAATMSLAFRQLSIDIRNIESAILRRVLLEPFLIGDVAEAATMFVLLGRMVSRIDLNSCQETPEQMVLTLCRRFPLFIERLQKRQRRRTPFSVVDEYDVQDLLYAILKLHFDDVRPEEYTPSYGGSSSKVDFHLPRERIVVEAKMTRASLGQKEVTDELIIDATRYAKMEGIETLICLVYDPGRRCGNPRTVENDVANCSSRLNVRAVVCPQGL